MRINLNELRRIIIEALLNAYQVLGIPPTASDDDIKKAWRSLAVQNHPDKGGSHGKMVDINNAKDRLLDKTALFRYGPSIKGYEDPHAPKPAAQAAPPPAHSGASSTLKSCPECGRSVAIRDGKFVNHYEHQPDATFPNPPKCRYSGQGATDNAYYGWRSQQRQSPPRQPPPPPPRPGPAPGGAPADNRNYYTYSQGTSNKFWEVETVGNVLHVRWGRIGSQGQTNSKTYPSSWRAEEAARKMRRNKVSRGYNRSTPPAGVPRPSQAVGPGRAAPGPQGPRPTPTGRPTKDNYKVYPWRGGRRVVRVGGKLYGTGLGGNLSGGGQTRFNANDRAQVTPDGARMKVKKPDSDHTQTWDAVEEVRQVVDELVLEMIVRVAEA